MKCRRRFLMYSTCVSSSKRDTGTEDEKKKSCFQKRNWSKTDKAPERNRYELADVISAFKPLLLVIQSLTNNVDESRDCEIDETDSVFML